MVRLYHQILDHKARGDDAERLLRQVLHQPTLTVHHDEKGRPYLTDGPEISISHSGKHLVVAVSEGKIGVDCQHLHAVYPGLPRRVMSDREYALYLVAEDAPAMFFTLWTLKESYYKYLGTGLPGFPNKTLFFSENGQWRLENAPQRFFVTEKNDLLIALCCDEQAYELINPE